MRTSPVNNLIQNFNAMLLDDKEFTIDIIKKAYAEARRDDILKGAKKATENYKKGKTKQGNYNDLLNDLEND